MSNIWSFELWRITGVVALGLLFGLVSGYLWPVLCMALAGYFLWHLIQLYRFERWLDKGEHLDPPDVGGVWGEIYSHLYRLEKRNNKRKRKLVSILNRFQESAAAMPDATVVLQAQGEIEWWNDAATRFLGLKAPQDIGQRVDNLLRTPVFTEYLANGDYSERVEFFSPVNEQITLSAQIVPYGKNQRLLVARDVTRIRRLEQMRRDFVANISHELKTPLTVVTGFLETMQDAQDECTSRWDRSLQLMYQQTSRMQRIVEDLLFLSRLESDDKPSVETEVNVPALLAPIREEALALSAGGHQIHLDVDEELWLRGDEMQLRSAFSNLVFNAVKYTPEDGEIRIGWYRNRDGAYFSVTDTGIGIPSKHIERLTERFYRVDVSRSRASGGTGLGLAIVKHVLGRHGAHLDIKSVEGGGSTFTCAFPKKRICAKPMSRRREASG